MLHAYTFVSQNSYTLSYTDVPDTHGYKKVASIGNGYKELSILNISYNKAYVRIGYNIKACEFDSFDLEPDSLVRVRVPLGCIATIVSGWVYIDGKPVDIRWEGWAHGSEGAAWLIRLENAVHTLLPPNKWKVTGDPIIKFEGNNQRWP